MTILYEDNHLLALNKPAGYLAQGDRSGDATVADWGKTYLKEKYAKPGAVFLHPAHRLDRPVSGVLLLARTDKALSRLTTMFRDHQIEKYYIALTLAAPTAPEGVLRHFLLKDEARNLVQAFSSPKPDAKESITRYQWLGAFGPHHMLKIMPLTGRPHQIRVQLSAIGCPIVGDLKYGAKKSLPDASIALHCLGLSFVHPVQKIPLHISAPFPETDTWRQIAEWEL